MRQMCWWLNLYYISRAYHEMVRQGDRPSQGPSVAAVIINAVTNRLKEALHRFLMPLKNIKHGLESFIKEARNESDWKH